MKKISGKDARAVFGFIMFIVMIISMVRAGTHLSDSDYMLLFTIMLSGFMSGG